MSREERNKRRRAYRQIPEVRQKELADKKHRYYSNIEKSRTLNRKYRNNRLEDRRKRSLAWYYSNKTKARENLNEWRALNRDKIRQYDNQRRRTNPSARMAAICTARIRSVIIVNTGQRKHRKTAELLGCDKNFLMRWIERQFKEGMSWDNYGVKGWHVDHIRPCRTFDLTDPNELMACFHYTNLQPLWWYENLAKSGKWKEAA